MSSAPAPAVARIPVYLLSGFLGSGKTTLLSAWLRQPGLRDAAIIVNELGEVGLDNALLGAASDSAALISNACVCCTGLPGLEEALEDLFWARLHRSMPAFPCVAIETTGLADPAPVIASFEGHPLLSKRYRLAGVLVTVGVPSGGAILAEHAEARAQVECADVLLMTKTDMATDGQKNALREALRARNGRAAILESSHAGLALQTVLANLGNTHTPSRQANTPQAPESSQARQNAGLHKPANTHEPSHQHHHGEDKDDHHATGHHHAAQAHFLPIQQALSRDRLLTRLHALASALGSDLLRLKGIVDLLDGTRVVVQYAPGESRFDIKPEPASAIATRPEQPIASGLTIIARGDAVKQHLQRLADKNSAA